jgi:hypothetical protein
MRVSAWSCMMNLVVDVEASPTSLSSTVHFLRRNVVSSIVLKIPSQEHLDQDDKENIEQLCSALCDNTSLTEIELSISRSHSSTKTEINEDTKTETKINTDTDTDTNTDTDDSRQLLFKHLFDNKRLHSFSYVNSVIDEDNVLSLCEYLMKPECTLAKLVIRNCNLSLQCHQHLQTALEINTSLLHDVAR